MSDQGPQSDSEHQTDPGETLMPEDITEGDPTVNSADNVEIPMSERPLEPRDESPREDQTGPQLTSERVEEIKRERIQNDLNEARQALQRAHDAAAERDQDA